MNSAGGADPFDDIRLKRRRGRALLLDEGSACLQGLLAALAACDRLTVTRWALVAAEPVAERLAAAFPQDTGPRDCLRLAWLWARGALSMRQARPAILTVHAMAARCASPEHAALCHALGQACSAVHSPRHAKGLAFYELTALVRRHGQAFEAPLRRQTARYLALLEALRAAPDPGPWAAFLLREPPARRRPQATGKEAPDAAVC